MINGIRKDDDGVFWIKLNPNVGSQATKPKAVKLPPMVKCLNCEGKGKGNGIIGPCSYCGGKGKLRDESGDYIPLRKPKVHIGKGYRREIDGTFWVKVDPKLRDELRSLATQRDAAHNLYANALSMLNELQKDIQFWHPVWYWRIARTWLRKLRKRK